MKQEAEEGAQHTNRKESTTERNRNKDKKKRKKKPQTSRGKNPN